MEEAGQNLLQKLAENDEVINNIMSRIETDEVSCWIITSYSLMAISMFISKVTIPLLHVCFRVKKQQIV